MTQLIQPPWKMTRAQLVEELEPFHLYTPVPLAHLPYDDLVHMVVEQRGLIPSRRDAS